MRDARSAEPHVRFAFGKNWRPFRGGVNDERLREAERSMKSVLQVETLAGKRFLDVGSGSKYFRSLRGGQERKCVPSTTILIR